MTNTTSSAGDVDPLAQFDALLKAKGQELLAPKEAHKKELGQIIEATRRQALNFERLAAEGSYEQLSGITFEAFIRGTAVELGNELPADLDKKMEAVRGIADRLSRFEGAADVVRNEPEIKAATEKLKQLGADIMRDWAKLLHSWFTELNERETFRASENDEAIQSVLKSPLFTATVKIENESYVSFRSRMKSEIIDKTFQNLIDKFCLKVIDGFKPGYHGSHDLSWLNSNDSSPEKLRKLKLYFQQINKDGKFDHYIKKIESLEFPLAGIRSLVEEKMETAIKAVESGVEDEAKRMETLSLLSKGNFQPIIQQRPEEDSLTIFVQLDDFGIGNVGTTNETMPGWYKKVMKAFLEIKVAEDFLTDGHILDTLEADQVLRSAMGEPAFRGMSVTYPAAHVLAVEIPKGQLNRDPVPLTIEPDFFARLGQIRTSMGTSYEYERLVNTLHRAAPEVSWDRDTQKMEVQGESQSGEKWADTIRGSMAAEKASREPTPLEAVTAKIEKGNGVLQISTIQEALALVEAMKALTTTQLMEAKTARDAKTGMEQELRQTKHDLGKVSEVRDSQKSQIEVHERGKADLERRSAEQLRSAQAATAQEKAGREAAQRTVAQLNKNVTSIIRYVEEQMAQVEQAGMFKQKDALKTLVAELQKKLAALTLSGL